jgi:hypothetical protein
MALKIPSRSGNGSSPGAPASSSTVYLKDFVNVLEFLSSLSGTGSSKRAPGTLSLTTKDGKWSCRVKDLTEKVYAYVTADSLDDVLSTLETGLGDGSLDWRPDNDNWKGKR